jgi:hypothetical protein
MSKLKIIYSQELEGRRIKDTISKIDWFITNKYNYKNFVFPKALNVERLRDYSEEEIKNAVAAEYSDDSYKVHEKFLLDNWDKFSKKLETAFLSSSLLMQSEYNICLTMYGNGGSYSMPNNVIVNVRLFYNANLMSAIIHEIIHLSIEKYIEKYKVGQWEKERIVDLFFMKSFPLRKIQNTYTSYNMERIDKIFEENFPDVKKKLSEWSLEINYDYKV